MAPVVPRISNPLGGLRDNHDFLRLLSGRLITNLGDSLFFIGAMWLAYDLTGSTLFTGLAGFLVRAPSVLTFLIGPLVDRWSIRRVLVSSQLFNGLAVLVIPVAHWTGNFSVWVLLAVLPVVTFVNQFVYPAQDVALPNLVTDEELTTANTLLRTGGRAVDMVFNAVSGVLIGVVGAVSLFVVDSVTFAVALVFFASISNRAFRDDEADQGDPAGYLEELEDGFAYIRRSLLVVFLGGVTVVNFSVGAVLGVLPDFAAAIGGPDAYGFLMGATAGGTLTGTLVAPAMDDVPFGWLLSGSFLFAGTAFAVALWSPWFSVTLVFFYLATLPVGVSNVLYFTVLQLSVDDELLGRVSSLSRSAAAAALPVGSVIGGAVATVVGTVPVMFTWTIGTVFFGLYVASHRRARSLPATVELDSSKLGLGRGTGETDQGR